MRARGGHRGRGCIRLYAERERAPVLCEPGLRLLGIAALDDEARALLLDQDAVMGLETSLSQPLALKANLRLLFATEDVAHLVHLQLAEHSVFSFRV